MKTKIAAIDIGTNSVLYSLFGVRGGRLEELHFERHSPRIGSRLATSRRPRISEESFQTLRNTLHRYLRHATKHDAGAILIAATNPLRLAQNGRRIQKRLADDLGLPVHILTSDDEAYLSFLGAVGPLADDKTAVVIDMGGGSTELVAYTGARRRAFVSIPEGAVSLTERFDSRLNVNKDDSPGFEQYLDRYTDMARTIEPYLAAPITLVGGTSSALGYLLDNDILRRRRGVVMTRAELRLLVDLLAGLNVTCRRQLLTIDKKRAEIIFAGAFCLLWLFNTLGIKKVRANPRGLRHGMALAHLTGSGFPA